MEVHKIEPKWGQEMAQSGHCWPHSMRAWIQSPIAYVAHASNPSTRVETGEFPGPAG